MRPLILGSGQFYFALLAAIFATAIVVVIGYFFSSWVDGDFLNLIVLDKILFIIGFIVAFNKIFYDYLEKKKLNKSIDSDIEMAMENPEEYAKKYRLKSSDCSALIIMVSKSLDNITPFYLINYFKPKKVALVCSDQSIEQGRVIYEYLRNKREVYYEKIVKDGRVVYRYCKDGNKENSNFESDSGESVGELFKVPPFSAAYVTDPKAEGYKACNFFSIGTVITSLDESLKELNVKKGNVGIDITSATAICSVAAFISSSDSGVNPIYLLKGKGGEFLEPDDVISLEENFDIEPDFASASIKVFKAPWHRKIDVKKELIHQ